MSQTESYAAGILAQAGELLGKVQHDLDASAAFYRSHAIDPGKLLSAVEPHFGAQQREELAQLIAADEAAVQREVEEGMARVAAAK